MTEVKIYSMIFNFLGGNKHNAISNNGSKVARTERGFKTLQERITSVVTVKVNRKEMLSNYLLKVIVVTSKQHSSIDKMNTCILTGSKYCACLLVSVCYCRCASGAD